MTILITGGAGFIGSHVAEALLKQKKDIIIVDNFNDYYDPKIKEQNIKEIGPVKVYRIDITDKEKLEILFKENKIEKIIHLAARAGVRPSIKDPELYERVNVKGTLNLLELARQYDIKKFIFASSSSVYGNNKKVPFSEEDNVDNPISPYAATKKAGELLCYTYHHLYDLNVACLRFFTVYGPRGRPDMAPYLFTEAISKGKEIKRFGDGTTKRDYTYVLDIVLGILAALDKDLGYEIINLGNSKTVELNYFISVIESLLGKKAEINQIPKQQGDVDITYADVSKAKRLLGYDPKVSIEEGMKRFVEWYKKKSGQLS